MVIFCRQWLTNHVMFHTMYKNFFHTKIKLIPSNLSKCLKIQLKITYIKHNLQI
ncbi:hypothetical protein C1645_779127 [Glomus cerebriforme]|uniref:Uncharacterized protein n=1 Tax=Glomus cerebriforme TaxID=658196 RepID=A0A397SMF6_9GLOM|nr:hypothetical protein C1645_782528 [Glomus cerebriforme]RIA86731.1 hypothetical protein C1645_779127 [Glomus cerebriforme]